MRLGSSMTERQPETPKLADDPAALPFLPLIYVAWADGDLREAEIDAIRAQVEQTPGLTPNSLARLTAWLDPAQPPRPMKLQELLGDIRRLAADLPGERRLSLVELGRELAGEAPPGELRAALIAVEDALGLAPAEAVRDLLATHEGPEAAGRPSFDVAAMARMLAEPRSETRQNVFEILQRPGFERRHEAPKEQHREQVLEMLQVLAGEGIGALSYPSEYGGADDMGSFAVAFETLAFGDISLTIKFGVQFGLFGGTVHALGTKRHHDKYLRDAGTLALPGCFAMTERGHGSNVAGIETTAVYDPATQEFIVNTPVDQAHKEYIGNAAKHGRMAVVFAQLEVGGESHGVHALLVPIRGENGETLPDVRIEDTGHKLGLNGIDNGRIWFSNVRVPRENLLNRYADVTPQGEYRSEITSPSKRFFTTIGALVAGRVSVALGALSAMKSGLTIAIRYGQGRRQFGAAGGEEVRLLDYLTHQRRLFPRLAKAYALDFALKDLVERFVDRSEEDQREIETLAAGLKSYATWANIEALQQCRECCGGQGYLSVNRFADLKADTDIFCTFEGDNTVLMQLVVKSLLSQYRRQFEDMRPFTLLKYVAARAADAVGAPNPGTAGLTDAEHLRSAEFQSNALRYREERLLGALARRLKHRLDEGQDSFYAMLDCQDHVMATANAHVERLVFESFEQGIAKLDADLAAPLEGLRSLFALSALEDDRAWFLEAGYVTSAKSRAIRDQVNELCPELRPDAVALVDAFGIPDKLLAAPIAM